MVVTNLAELIVAIGGDRDAVVAIQATPSHIRITGRIHKIHFERKEYATVQVVTSGKKGGIWYREAWLPYSV